MSLINHNKRNWNFSNSTFPNLVIQPKKGGKLEDFGRKFQSSRKEEFLGRGGKKFKGFDGKFIRLIATSPPPSPFNNDKKFRRIDKSYFPFRKINGGRILREGLCEKNRNDAASRTDPSTIKYSNKGSCRASTKRKIKGIKRNIRIQRWSERWRGYKLA